MNIEEIGLPDHLIQALDTTPQNPKYHAEGSVLEHTKLVRQQLDEIGGQFDLTDRERVLMAWAAWLHDVGKITTTCNEKGRWRSPGHERAGVPVAREILLTQSDLNPAEIHQVLEIVRFHGIPLKYMLNGGNLDQLKRLAVQTDLRKLAIFAMLDIWGRDCIDQEKVRGVIQEFHEQVVPKVHYEFATHNDLQQAFSGWNLRHKNAAWKTLKLGKVDLIRSLMQAEPYQDIPHRGREVIITIGLPKAGKTAYIEKHFPHHFNVQLHEHRVTEALASDNYELGRQIVEFKNFLTVYLNRYQKVILEGSNLNESVRTALTDMVREREVKVRYLQFLTTRAEFEVQNNASELPISEETREHYFNQWNLIHPWAAHEMIWARSGE